MPRSPGHYCGLVDDVEQRHRQRQATGEGIERLVKGIVAQDDAAGIAGRQRAQFALEQRCDAVECLGRHAVARIAAADLVVIDAVHEQPRRVVAAEPFLGEFVQEPVVDHRGRPARAAEHADRLHGCWPTA